MDELIAIDKQLLLWFNGSDSLILDGLATTLTSAVTWAPLYLSLLYLVIKNNGNMQKILFVVCGAVLCVLLAGTLNDLIIKPEVARWRPSRDPEIAMLVDVVNGYRGGRYGFFSSHAANTFSIAVFFALIVRNRVLTITLICWSLVNCWTRLYLGVHFPADVLCGLLWGGMVGTFVWFLYSYLCRKAFSYSNRYISTQYTSTGYMLSDIDVVLATMMFTLVYAIIKSCFILYL